MTPTKGFQILLILIEGGMLAYLSDNPWPPAILASVSLVGLLPMLPISFSRRLATQFFILGTLLLSFHWALFPPQFISFSRLDFYRTGYLLSEIILMVQLAAVTMVLPRFWKHIVPFSGVLVYMFAGIRLLRSHDHRAQLYGYWAMAFVIVLGFYAMSTLRKEDDSKLNLGRGARAIALSMVLLATSGLILVLNWNLPKLEGKVADLAVGFLRGQRVDAVAGWGESSHLRSIQIQKDEQDSHIVLRIFAGRPPIHVKGLVFDRYDQGRWLTPSGYEDLFPDSPPDVPFFKQHSLGPIFRASKNPWPEDLYEIGVWQDSELGSRLFRVLETEAFSVESASLLVDELGNLRMKEEEKPGSYRILVGQPGDRPLIPVDASRWLVVDSSLEEKCRPVAETIFKNQETIEEKLTALKRYFVQEHGYSLGIEISTGVDPIVYFLTEKKAAHCEYFASAATLLLRMEGIPARYVTGFLCLTRNQVGGYWVATNDEAHAWVEVHTPEDGWKTFDPTPPEGLPQVDPPSIFANLFDAAWFRTKTFVSACYRVVSQLTIALFTFIQSLGAREIAIGSAILGAVTVALGWKRRRKKVLPVGVEVEREVMPDLDSLRSLLKTMDRFVSSKNFERGSSETYHRFADRLTNEWNEKDLASEVSGWYRAYAHARFAPAGLPDRLNELSERLSDLTQTAEGNP
ncbi:MAG: transglutaminase domain-containing protein [Candidatus Omnitrophica bacterium]|nr:transglutaminase domain-containing protein [Candidatus Omnitrophota bacterium]